MGDRIDVGKYRAYFLPVQGMRGSHKCVRGQNDFTGQAQGTNCDFQGNGTIAHGDAMFDLMMIGDTLLERLHQRTVITQPAGIKIWSIYF